MAFPQPRQLPQLPSPARARNMWHCRSLLALALLPLSAGQGVAPLLKAIEGNNPSQINMALKSTHPKLLKEVDGSGASAASERSACTEPPAQAHAAQ